MPLRVTNPTIYNKIAPEDWDALDYSVNGIRVLTTQQLHIDDPAGGTTIDVQLRTAIIAVLDLLGAHGLMVPISPIPSNGVVDGGILVTDGGITVIDS